MVLEIALRREKTSVKMHARRLKSRNMAVMDAIILKAAQSVLQNITKSKEMKLERLWSEYQNVLNEYIGSTESFYVDYMDLKENGDLNTKITQNHCYELQRAADEIEKLNIIIADLKDRSNFQVTHLTKMRNKLNERLTEAQKEFQMLIKRDKEMFQLVAVTSYEMIKFLEECEKKGQTLAHMATACHSLESEKDSMRKRYRQAFETSVESFENVSKVLDFEKEFGNFKQMENFWHRVNNVRLDVLSLEQEKIALEKNNAELKTSLQEYLVELNISTGTSLDAVNYLVKKISQSMSSRRLIPIDLGVKSESAGATRKMSRPNTTCIEANFTNAVRTKRLSQRKHKSAEIHTIISL